MSYEVIVVGLGAMGSATLYELSRRGIRALGIDQYEPPHRLGSTHGRTRIIREAYFEHPLYVPLVRRAYELWAELERVAKRRLFHRTGGLMIGPEEGVLVAGSRRSAVEHGVPHEMLSAAEVRRRWPAYDPPESHAALFELRAGLLLPEACIETYLALSRQKGVAIHVGERVIDWAADANGVTVRTDRAMHYGARLVFAAGAWLPRLVRDASMPLAIERQMFHWFEPTAQRERHHAEHCPLALWEFEPDRMVAMFPDLGDGVKTGIHHEGEITDPTSVRRTTSAAEDAEIRKLLAQLMPDAAGRQLEARVCLYTNTPDHDFLIDAHPQHDNVFLVSPCSGHGFKFASAIGEIAADLATRGESSFDLTPFRLGRFASTTDGGLRTADSNLGEAPTAGRSIPRP